MMITQRIVVYFTLLFYINFIIHDNSLSFVETSKVNGNCDMNKSLANEYMTYDKVKGKPYKVEYDDRSFIIDGKHTLLLGGSVHYPRAFPSQWQDVLKKMKEDGLNHVEIYIFWNLHEPIRGKGYDFTSHPIKNLTNFFDVAIENDLFINMRIGPYISAEWTFGGLPLWLRDIKGIELRTNNELWKYEMEKFVRFIVKLSEPYLARNGGPIIMAQIENEYHGSSNYVNWCGDLVDDLSIDIPWVMCNGMSANNTVNMCNGYGCFDKFAVDHDEKFPHQPLGWTENEGWFNSYYPLDGNMFYRYPSEMAYEIAKWFAAGGSHHNYYMYYGGNHYERWGAKFITNMYANGVNLHSDGLPNEPKRSHLNRLHFLLIKYQDILFKTCIPNFTKDRIALKYYNLTTKAFEIGTEQYAYIFGDNNNNDRQLHFVINDVLDGDVLVELFNDQKLNMPPKSVTIILVEKDGNKRVYKELYSTADIDILGVKTERIYVPIYDLSSGLKWKTYTESLPDFSKDDKDSFIVGKKGDYPIEQLKLTNDLSDYLFYQCTLEIPIEEEIRKKQQDLNLNFTITYRESNIVQVFINDGIRNAHYNDDNYDSHGPKNFTFQYLTALPEEANLLDINLTILSTNMGISSRVDKDTYPRKGLSDTNHIFLNNKSIETCEWKHRPFLRGEKMKVYENKSENENIIKWTDGWETGKSKPLTWFQTSFKTPKTFSGLGDNSLLIDTQGLGRGHLYLNGFDLGRYYTVTRKKDNYKINDWTQDHHGDMCQRYYQIPPDLLVKNENDENILTIGEELGAPDPSSVRIVGSKFIVPSSTTSAY